MVAIETRPGTGAQLGTAENLGRAVSPEHPWQTVVWDDPVNLMSYVTHVFVTYFGFGATKANKLMMRVHTEGKAVVSTGTREEMERDVDAMHGYGLWATLERSE